MKEMTCTLQNYLNQGYCLHGSPRQIKLLEPRQAKCETGRVCGCQKAVYAEKNDIRIPCLMALFARKHFWKRNRQSSYTGTTFGTLIVTGENVTFKPGFVHVLPSDTFQWFDDEFISYEPVKPIVILRITPKIVHYLNNLDIRF